MTQFGFPYRVAADGRTADATVDDHVRQLIALVLFTGQGERIMRPDFGCGVNQLVFAENAPELASALQHIIQAGLQRWLAELIEVRAVDVRASDSTLAVLVRFRAVDTDEERTVRVVRQA
jgi:phage baseplate assembly protein W